MQERATESMTTEMINDLEWTASPVPHDSPQRKRQTIRRLNVRPTRKMMSTIKSTGRKRKCSLLCKISTAILVLAAFGTLASTPYARSIYEKLKQHYREAHAELSRETSSLCAKRSANFKPILETVEHTVIGQPHLSGELNEWFQMVWKRPFHCALFVGGSGTGKSLTVSLIAKHYPYPTNVLYVLGDEFTDEKKRYGAFKRALFNIQRSAILHSHCAHYLLVMDHLRTDNMQLVTKVSNRLRRVSEEFQLQIQALFVMRPAGDHDLRQNTLSATIPEVRLVEFKPIGANELEACIRREAVALGMDPDGGETSLVQRVANEIDPTRHGCKHVRAKLIPYSVEQEVTTP